MHGIYRTEIHDDRRYTAVERSGSAMPLRNIPSKVLVAIAVGVAYCSCWGQSYQPAKVLSVRQVRHGAGFPISRYPTTPQYTIALSLDAGDKDYCAVYDTPVLDEVHDSTAAIGQKAQVMIDKKKILVLLPNGRKIHANLANSGQC